MNLLDENELILLKKIEMGLYQPEKVTKNVVLSYDELQDFLDNNNVIRTLSFLSFIEKETGTKVFFKIDDVAYSEGRIFKKILDEDYLIYKLITSKQLSQLLRCTSIEEVNELMQKDQFIFILALLDCTLSLGVSRDNPDFGYKINLQVCFDSNIKDKINNLLSGYLDQFGKGKLASTKLNIFNLETHLALFSQIQYTAKNIRHSK